MGKTMKDTKGKQALLKEGGVYLIFGVLTTAVDYAISNYLFYMAGMGAVFSQIHKGRQEKRRDSFEF